MWSVVLFAVSIVAAVNVSLCVAHQTSKKEMRVPDTIDVDLLKRAKTSIEADPRERKEIKEYLSIGLLKSKLSENGLPAVEVSERGRRILPDRD